MSPSDKDVVTFADGFPRVSGDEPWSAKFLRAGRAFSPRERG